MTYEYICAACGHEWEAEQAISAQPLKKCPSCGKPKARRQISGGTGFLLKGGGWYADGYGSKPAGESKSKSKSDAAEPSAASDSSASSSKKETGKDSKKDKPAAKPVSSTD